MNIALNYLYRDGGNYKRYHTLIFSNPSNAALQDVTEAVMAKLIDGMWFYSSKWNVPDLHFDKWDDELDHQWHEFCSIEETDEPQTSGDIFRFLERLA